MARFVVIVTAVLLTFFGPVAALSAKGAPPSVPDGFALETIAHVNGARELAVAGNGDLFVGTNGNAVHVVPNAQGGTPGAARVFAQVDDRPVAGVTIHGDTMYLGAQFGVYELPYHTGDTSPRTAPRKIATLRPSGVSRDHVTATVAVSGETLYASVGSSCNNCQPDLDATRATIQAMHLDGTQMAPKAERIRNAIALTVDPQTGALWTGVAGQDELEHGHPYEIVDDVTAHAGRADYGWPNCYEDRRPAGGTHDCSNVAVPRVALPAYETPIGITFYPVAGAGRYDFGAQYRGGVFVALHGSWHAPPVPPRVVFIPMHGDEPATPVDWSDPTKQWHEFVGGYQAPDGSRVGRPTGVAVGTDGSLFVADDESGNIYRIRPKH